MARSRDARVSAGGEWNCEVCAKAIREDCSAIERPISGTPWPMLTTAAWPEAIAKQLADEKISLESIVQRHSGGRPHGGDDPASPATPAPVILITYATTEDAVRRALNAIKNQGVIAGQPQVIRIEKN